MVTTDSGPLPVGNGEPGTAASAPLALFIRRTETLLHATQMRYRPSIESDFSVLVVLHPKGRIETFKYRASEMICEASGPDFRTAMIQTTGRGLALDEPNDNQDSARQPCD